MYFVKRTIIVLLLFATACINNKTSHPLKIDNAYTQSWTTAAGVSRGTRVAVSLTGKVKNTKVLAIIYNKQQLTPTVTQKDKQLIVSADFEKGTQQVFAKPATTEKEDMVIYSYEGKIYELPIGNFERKATNYYPVK